MKVKELKKILNDYDDEKEIYFRNEVTGDLINFKDVCRSEKRIPYWEECGYDSEEQFIACHCYGDEDDYYENYHEDSYIYFTEYFIDIVGKDGVRKEEEKISIVIEDKPLEVFPLDPQLEDMMPIDDGDIPY